MENEQVKKTSHVHKVLIWRNDWGSANGNKADIVQLIFDFMQM